LPCDLGKKFGWTAVMGLAQVGFKRAGNAVLRGKGGLIMELTITVFIPQEHNGPGLPVVGAE
jgi:hypothetical protein